MYLHVEAKNTPAQLLYSKMDYRLVAEDGSVAAAPAALDALTLTAPIGGPGAADDDRPDPNYGKRFKITTYDDIFYYRKTLGDVWEGRS